MFLIEKKYSYDDGVKFSVKGHPNVLSTHKSTLEFITSPDLTKKGDCILGVSADNNFSRLKHIIPERTSGKLKVKMIYGKISDELSGYKNPYFSDSSEIVLRKSDHIDQRTGLIMSNKAAKDIDRRIIKGLQNPNNSLEIYVKPLKIRNLVFDFDDTLEIWSENELIADRMMSDYVADHIAAKNDSVDADILSQSIFSAFSEAKSHFIRKRWSPQYYGRSVWMRTALATLELKIPASVLKDAEKLYWKEIDKIVSLYPGVKGVLEKLRKKYKLFIYSDSDGEKKLKVRRMKKLGVYDLFDKVLTSDDTGFNKPHKKGFDELLRKTKIDPHETAFIGDHPEVDHIRSKIIGMSTVLLAQGPYAERSQRQNYPYVDFVLDSIGKLPELLKSIDDATFLDKF